MTNFGYDEHYSSTLPNTIQNALRGTRGIPSESGTLDTLHAYIAYWGAGEKIKGVLYNFTTGEFVAVTNESSVGGATGWCELTFPGSPAITAGTSYLITIFSDGTVSLYYNNYNYDENIPNAGGVYSLNMGELTYPDYPSDLTGGYSQQLTSYSYEIYCAYTPSAGEEESEFSVSGDGKLVFSGGTKQLQFITG